MTNEAHPDLPLLSPGFVLPCGEKTDAPPPSIFDLSFHGGLPTLLRAIADRIDAGETAAQTFEWSLSKERLKFTVLLDLDEVNPE